MLLSSDMVKFCALVFGRAQYTPGGRLKSLQMCEKCGRTKSLVTHHITYKPNLLATLCRVCHNKITVINTVGAIVKKTGLKKNLLQANKTRVFLWKWFIGYKGKITKVAIMEALEVECDFTTAQLNYIEKAHKRLRY